MIGNKEIAKITLNLIIVYLIGGLFLALIYAKTTPIIYKNSIAAKNQALKKIMPDADAIEQMGSWSPHEQNAEYYAAKKSGRTCGYIVESYAKGYSGYIHLLVATDTSIKITRITVLAHTETPGLGDGIETPWFQSQFPGKTVGQMKAIKGPTTDNIQALSGATISSRAVTEDGVKNALEMLHKTIAVKVAPNNKNDADIQSTTEATPVKLKKAKSAEGDTTYVR